MINFKNKKDQLFVFSKNDKKLIFFGSILSLFASIFAAFLPFILSSIIENSQEAISKPEKNLEVGPIIISLTLMLVFGILSILFNLFARRYLARFSTFKLAEIRREIFSKTQNLTPEDLNQHKNNSLMTRLITDNINYANYFNFASITLIPTFFRLIVFSTMCFIFNWATALILMGVCLIFYVVIFLFTRNSEKNYFKYLKDTDSINKIIQENIIGVRVVKAFNLKNRQRERYEKINGNLVSNATKAEQKAWHSYPFALMFVNLVSIIIIITSGLLNWGEVNLAGTRIDISSIIAFINLSFLIIWSVFELVIIKIFKSRSTASRDRMAEIISIKRTIYNDSEQKFENGDIIFKDVSFKYNEESIDYVLKNINLTIKKDSTVGIIGPTGSGKTSLLYLIARLYEVSKGEIKINEKNIKEINSDSLVENISFAFQQKYLFGGTIKSNIQFGNENITNDEINKILEVVCLDSFVKTKKDGINYKLEQSAQNLSGGQKQRLSIARAIAKNSPLIIFDDATSALDNITEKKIIDSLKEMKNTKIFVAQKISTIKDFDQIIVLDKGNIVGIGKHEELLKNCSFYKEIDSFQNRKGK